MLLTLNRNRIPYVQWHDEAERRNKRGERQVRCPDCKLHYFPNWPEDVNDHKRRCKLEQKDKEIILRNEKTSKRVSTLASKLLQEAKACKRPYMTVKVADLKSLAASALTQTADKK